MRYIYKSTIDIYIDTDIYIGSAKVDASRDKLDRHLST